MKLLRHILSHLFLISFLIAVVSVFYYRTLLLPNNVVVKIDSYINEVYPPALSFVSKRDYFWSIRGERIVSFDDLKLFDKKVEVSVEAEAVIETEKTTVVEVEQQDNKTPDIVVAQNDNPVVENKPAPAPAPIVVAPVVDNAETLPVVIRDKDTSSERDLLISARSAFNHGKVMESEKFYLELTQLANDNPDTFGELGNVYYSQGKWNKAGQAYYEAAIRLIEIGKLDQVVYLQRVIKGLNAEQAEKLAQLMVR